MLPTLQTLELIFFFCFHHCATMCCTSNIFSKVDKTMNHGLFGIATIYRTFVYGGKHQLSKGYIFSTYINENLISTLSWF